MSGIISRIFLMTETTLVNALIAPLNHNKFKNCHNRGTKGSYNRSQPLKNLKMSHHDFWLTTKSGKKSEAKEAPVKNDRLVKLVSFNTIDEIEVKIVDTKNKNQPEQSQMTTMMSSTSRTSCLLDSERATISVARWFVLIT